ncbi:2-hydroxyacid dehydrogenase [Pelobacter seleniigenes]|uniref:2-hydroxyacid dehydrogenase n=1 Tax=Pelobacter seleniigenes TaxID=407188 RepID=UPI0004A6CBCE|nr:2-hydroxyacid dehydrogenase [Pelobacter seleniigenes]
MLTNILQVGTFPALMQREVTERVIPWTEQDLAARPELKQQVQGLITRSNIRISEELIRSLPNLRIIASCGVGYDLIPVSFARDRGIVVSNTPEVLNAAVAELCIGMLIGLLRQLHTADQFVRKSLWLKQAYPLTRGLAGKRVGIIGMGRIGKEIGLRLEPFGTTIAYFSRQRKPLPWHYAPSLTELANASDILIAVVPGGAETRHMIDAKILRALGPQGYFVNIARGSVVDEEALLTALETGEIAGAALDVYASEPAINQRFLNLDNVLLSPHAGSATTETRQTMIQLAITNLEAFFATGKILTPVY